MREARALLSERIPTLRFTRNMQTQPIGHAGPSYLNCLCRGTTSLSLPDLLVMLKDVERQCGDTPEHRSCGHVLMDIDLLSYDGIRHHADDWERPYIINLLKSLPLESPIGEDERAPRPASGESHPTRHINDL